MLAVVPADMKNVRSLQLPKEPTALTKLTRADDESLRQRAFRLHTFFTWPGSAQLLPEVENVSPLSPEQKRLTDLGKEQFAIGCVACHQPHGGGLPNVAPPLSGSEWVNGPPELLARILLHGLYGPVEVRGQQWNLHMPGFDAAFDDEKIAAILTYIRRAWGNAADPVEPALVSRVRKETQSRTLAWTVGELKAATTVASEDERRIIRPDDKGELKLSARLATTYGRELAYRPSLDILAPWRRENDVAEWQVAVSASSAYEVFVMLAADNASAGDKFLIETEGSRISGIVQSSGGYDQFREYRCGQISLRAGANRLVMRPDGPLKRELADVRALRLVPAPKN
jgi:mono/diheme cytochrome c family protein